MLPELAHFSLILALCFALLQTFFAARAVIQPKILNQIYLRQSLLGHHLFLLLSFILLIVLFVQNDFSVQYVAQNSNSQLPLIYRVCATWGAHEGSMLLWVFMLSSWSVALLMKRRSIGWRLQAKLFFTLGLVSSGFLIFLLSTSNPFIRVLFSTPTEGMDLNPLLQDPGFIIHPPMLYLGYVGFAIVFAFAIAALWDGQLTKARVQLMRPWTLAAWSFLTFGIVLGSWWAYRELGWGGWWFWDPVENASFMPWLIGTALIHSQIVSDKRDAFKLWTIFLAILAFALSVLGTFLVRSGILVSVHTFASDPSRGVVMLSLLAMVILITLILYSWRAPLIQSKGTFQLLSRETFLLLNNIVFLSMTFMILLGTLYPLIIEVLGINKISVGTPYFNTLFIPLMSVLFILMGIGPHIFWRTQRNKRFLVNRILIWGVTGLLIAVFLSHQLLHQLNAKFILAIFFITWLSISWLFDVWLNAKQKRQRLGMWLAHLGLIVTTMGVVGVSFFSIEKEVSMSVGDSLIVKDHEIRFEDIQEIDGPNYQSLQGQFRIQPNLILMPEKRFYPARKNMMTDAAIDAGLFGDWYIALGTPVKKEDWTVRIYYKSMIRWIWFGGILMLLGGIVTLFTMRRSKCSHGS